MVVFCLFFCGFFSCIMACSVEGGLKLNSLRMLKIARNGYIVISLLFCAIGVWMYTCPAQAAELICIMVGILFILSGTIKMIGYFSKDFYCLAFQFDFAFGILMAAVGVIIITRRSVLQDLIFGIFGLMILADSLFKIQICLDARRFGLDTLWWKIMIMALATGVLGTLLLIVPFDGIAIMMQVGGISFIAEGLLNLFVALFTVKILEVGAGKFSGGRSS